MGEWFRLRWPSASIVLATREHKPVDRVLLRAFVRK